MYKSTPFTAWKWKYSEIFEPRIRFHESLKSWGIQGAHLTWSILKYSARIHPNILCWVSFVDFPKRTLQQILSASYWWKQFVRYDEKDWKFERLKTVFNITCCGWFYGEAMGNANAPARAWLLRNTLIVFVWNIIAQVWKNKASRVSCFKEIVNNAFTKL